MLPMFARMVAIVLARAVSMTCCALSFNVDGADAPFRSVLAPVTDDA